MNTALDRACKILGSQDALAAVLGIRSASISGWRERKRVPAERCVAIEQATGGQVTRYELRPDVFGPPGQEPPTAHQPAAEKTEGEAAEADGAEAQSTQRPTPAALIGEAA